MSISKVSELIGSSPESFEAAARHVVARANRTLRGVSEVELLEKSMKIADDQIVEYRVRLRLQFSLAPRADLHW